MALPDWWRAEQEAEYQEVLRLDRRHRQNIGILESNLRKEREQHAVISKRLDQLERQRNGEATFPGLE